MSDKYVHLAAQRLIHRYYRRFSQDHQSMCDVGSVMDRKWYRNTRRLIAVRIRLGGALY